MILNVFQIYDLNTLDKEILLKKSTIDLLEEMYQDLMDAKFDKNESDDFISAIKPKLIELLKKWINRIIKKMNNNDNFLRKCIIFDFKDLI